MIHIILVNYGQAACTLDCLAALDRQTHIDFRVWIVDHPTHFEAPLGMQEALQKGCPLSRGSHAHDWAIVSHPEDKIPDARVILAPAKSNLGFAGGCNYGIQIAQRTQTATGYWLLNNDACPEPNALTELVLALTNQPQVGLFGSALYHMDAQGVWGDVQAYAGRWRPWCGWTEHITQMDKISLADYVVGASLLIRPETLAQVGLLPEDEFLYYEETEYAARARDLGWTVAAVPESRVGHLVSCSICGPAKAYYTARNHLRFWWRRYPLHLGQALLFLVYARLWRFRNSPRERRALLLGIRDFFGGQSGRCPHQL